MGHSLNGSVKPRVVVSKCLEFEPCRYNGLQISSHVVKLLKHHVEFLPVCPEIEIGLGVPRDPIRICERGEKRALIQPATDLDVTADMRRFIKEYFESMENVDGIIMKSRSPSCGIRDVKIYAGPEERAHYKKGSGFFGGTARDRLGHLAIEDEARLTNFRIREHFLTKLYVMSRFRLVRSSPTMKGIIDFQSNHKLLLMAYNQKELRELGRITANHDRKPVSDVIVEYGEHLARALAKSPRYTSNINVLMHGFGYFSKKLSPRERGFFLDSLEHYRAGRIPLSVLQHTMRSWILRFDTKYLSSQTFFVPYPETLVEITDSGKGRKM